MTASCQFGFVYVLILSDILFVNKTSFLLCNLFLCYHTQVTERREEPLLCTPIGDVMSYSLSRLRISDRKFEKKGEILKGDCFSKRAIDGGYGILQRSRRQSNGCALERGCWYRGMEVSGKGVSDEDDTTTSGRVLGVVCASFLFFIRISKLMWDVDFYCFLTSLIFASYFCTRLLHFCIYFISSTPFIFQHNIFKWLPKINIYFSRGIYHRNTRLDGPIGSVVDRFDRNFVIFIRDELKIICKERK